MEPGLHKLTKLHVAKFKDCNHTLSTRDHRELFKQGDKLQLKVGFEKGSAKVALMNVLANLLWCADQYEKALAFYKKALEHDPKSLNAVAGLVHLSEVGQDLEFENCADLTNQLTELKEKARTDSCITAQYIAEQAFAYYWDVSIDQDPKAVLDRYGLAIKKFKECLSYLHPSNKEYTQVCFYIAECCYRRFRFCTIYKGDIKQNPDESALQDLQIAIEYYSRCKDIDDPYYKCRLYSSIGIIATKFKKLDKSVARQGHNIAKIYGFEQLFQQPQKCFDIVAKEISQVSDTVEKSKSLARLGYSYLKTKLLSKAEQALNQSLEYYNKAEVTWLTYKKLAKTLLELHNKEPNREQVRKALECYDKSFIGATGTYIPKCHHGKGKAYFELAKCEKNQEKKKDLLEKANYCFLDAIRHHFGETLPKIHHMRGECLEELSEFRGSVESYKRAIENDNEHKRVQSIVRAVGILMQLYSKAFEENNDEEGTCLCVEIMYWVEKAIEKYDRTELINGLRVKLQHETNKQMPVTLFELCNRASNVSDFKAPVILCLEALKKCKLPSKLVDQRHINGLIQQIELSTLSIDDDEKQKLIQAIPDNATNLTSQRPENQFSYDFVALYAKPDLPWISNSLLPRLEQHKKFRGYIQDRDSHPGEDEITALCRGLERSRKCLIVLSPSFMSSKWCDYAMKQAVFESLQEKREGNNVIPLYISPDVSIPSAVQIFASLDLSAEHFIEYKVWNKLYEALREGL